MNNIHKINGRIFSLETLAINIANNYHNYNEKDLPTGTIVTVVDGTTLANYVVSDEGGLCRKLRFLNKLQDLVVPSSNNINNDLSLQSKELKDTVLKLESRINKLNTVEFNLADIFYIRKCVFEILQLNSSIDNSFCVDLIFESVKNYCTEFVNNLLSKIENRDLTEDDTILINMYTKYAINIIQIINKSRVG